MRKNRAPETDGAVIPYCYSFRMEFVDIYILADPYVFSDRNATHPVKLWPYVISSRHYEGQFMEHAINNIVEHHLTFN